jgi:HD-GYP domain-containing protein (c-di-GMP phosphodiesterase class II)
MKFWSDINRSVLTEAYHAVRPIGVSVLALAVLACIMAGNGWKGLSLVLAGSILLLSAVIAAQVHRAVSRLRRQTEDTREAALEAERNYICVLQEITRYADSREPCTRGRSERIGNLSEAIARKLGLPEEKCLQMSLAGQLHDLGMLSVSERILGKRSLLGSKEFRIVQQHSEVSRRLLTPLASLADILPTVRHHHERMNGTGYPDGLAGENIPLGARILAVADCFDSVTHDRSHRAAITPMEAMRELRRCTPAGYDSKIVEALSQVLRLPNLEQVQEASPKAEMPDVGNKEVEVAGA